MSLITPSNRSKGRRKGGPRNNENNRIYGNPLPVIFNTPTERPPIYKALGLFGIPIHEILNPHCEGFVDVATRSVWVSDSKQSMLLWQRGFFGKGDLSRSEPSWLARQINARKQAGKGLTSEEITAKRRAERKQFKLDRAQAIAAAAADAEAAFAEGRVVPTPGVAPDGTRLIPSAATWKPSTSLEEVPQLTQDDDDEGDGDTELEEPLENIEHLQLTFPEAFFLSWTLDCLTVCNSEGEPLTLAQVWTLFQDAHSPTLLLSIPPPQRRFDNPFLVNYAVYHHYRSLGWVVKSGIKFCVDYLLYKRGPVFHHAEFAIVVCPVYEDPADQTNSPFDLQNASPFSWSWLSTINRVNSQVQKTLILTYVTIPALSRLREDVLSSPACLAHYSVREVVLRRFIPARMRD
ncbi:hypothetical protein SERLA73DRAFT_117634 [Serpula lacrymans var. lacrymans S7.3]|uniref:tRNA-splicing endonuclease subunit Sen2 n=2 Tax=Serpula lacrymans var. lacrymans TaxID=341189 RepID=F8QHL2_SERL3|nr:uncharacterized protein SERLADRAFT_362541 [Serpula lacrymans var. lacrymans S7.9]EGN92189.1 hypothetical protein SERLA73DRAFT_117634 [Serpula lacrymans var. lacrymans S7.3]EGO22127.1 hypothetical protein SERLADRAFT_362541 [Serpula lacrymans var. lacrymans S7.9]